VLDHLEDVDLEAITRALENFAVEDRAIDPK
jgi:hypothetical protein